MSKFVIISLLAAIAVVNARGLNGDLSDIKSNDIAPLQKESRFLDVLVFPSLATIILKSLKGAWFLLTTLCTVIDFKLAALAVAVNAGIWLLKTKFSIVLGAVLMFGFCKLSGLCAFKGIFAAEEPDHLAYASDYLDIGTMKYEKSS